MKKKHISRDAKPLPLEKKIVLVTGASRGIGSVIAQQFADQGMTVVGTGKTQEGADRVTKMLADKGNRGVGKAMDISNPESVREVLSEVVRDIGAPLILINNAGITRDGLMLRMKEEQWEDVIRTNLSGAFYVTKQCLKAMFKARWGRIINISSVVGVMGNPGQVNYVSSKAGIIGFTKSLAMEMASVGVTVNAVAPGYIESDMTRELTEKQENAILSMIPMRCIGNPLDVAHAVNFLVGDGAAYITGQTLHVNGGMCMV